MTKQHFDPLAERHDIAMGFALLSRLPVRIDVDRSARRGAQAAWAWPLVGAVLGLGAGSLGALLLWLGASGGLAAVAALGAMAMLTGAMHEDGLADCADGAGGHDPAARLAIMRDSRIGTYGALALILMVLGRWSAIADLSGWTLVLGLAVAGAVSRAAMVFWMHALPSARPKGLSADLGHPARRAVWLGFGVALAVSVSCGLAGLVALLSACTITLPVALWARRRLGGQTGDVLGAVQQCAELGAFMALSALL